MENVSEYRERIIPALNNTPEPTSFWRRFCCCWKRTPQNSKTKEIATTSISTPPSRIQLDDSLVLPPSYELHSQSFLEEVYGNAVAIADPYAATTENIVFKEFYAKLTEKRKLIQTGTFGQFLPHVPLTYGLSLAYVPTTYSQTFILATLRAEINELREKLKENEDLLKCIDELEAFIENERNLDSTRLFTPTHSGSTTPNLTRPGTPTATEELSLPIFHTLVVDDQPVVRKVNEKIASKFGQCQQAPDGPEALELLEKDLSIDLLLIDMDMPKMRGDTLISRIRLHENQSIRNTMAILVSAHTIENWEEMGFDGFITKPLTKASLETTLEGLRGKEGRRWPEVQNVP